LLVIAGAGTGKTKTLAHRAAHLIANGVDPHRILLLTFSRRAAAEMTGRVKRITAAALGTRHVDLAWAGTFARRQDRSELRRHHPLAAAVINSE
jgi:DNA helicase-2/ATP-dependent DNA helicase PcrA